MPNDGPIDDLIDNLTGAAAEDRSQGLLDRIVADQATNPDNEDEGPTSLNEPGRDHSGRSDVGGSADSADSAPSADDADERR